MRTTRTFRLADQLFKGELADRIRHYRTAGVPFEAIAVLLDREVHIGVTGETIRRWAADLGIERESAAS